MEVYYAQERKTLEFKEVVDRMIKFIIELE
jgi:hypothetical protein